jgi:hypothetical protein
MIVLALLCFVSRLLLRIHVLTGADETRPICLRCKKRGIDCDGPRGPTWIDQSKSFGTKSPPKLSIVQSSYTTQLSIVAFRDDICLAYSRTRLLRGGPFELACNKISFYGNAPVFSSHPALGLLRKSVISLAEIYFGVQHCDDDTTARGYIEYGEVLRRLNSTLAITTDQTTNEVLLTALICMLSETLFPTGPANFLKHQRGIEDMMRLRGPPTETTGETATIFRGLRIVSIVSALLESRPSLYANEEWGNAPVATTTEIGMLQHKIFAILAVCTQLTSECGALIASGVGPECYRPLLLQVDTAMASLTALYPLWERINKAYLRDTEHMSHLAKDLGIANRLTATAYILYYTARICIFQIRDSLNPLPIHLQLRNDAAMKIGKCLKLKEIEKQESSAVSNTIDFVATKITWQALGGSKTPEGQTLADVVKSSVNGVYQWPRETLLP